MTLDGGAGVGLDAAGGIFIGGFCDGSIDWGGGPVGTGGSYGGFLVKLDAVGELVWSHAFDGAFVNGLAVTSVGGDLLPAEATVIQGKGKLVVTGLLEKGMEESAHAAMTYVRSRLDRLGLDKDSYQKVDVHVHFPDFVRKDGPSAGVTMVTAVVSALMKAPVRRDLAMNLRRRLSSGPERALSCARWPSAWDRLPEKSFRVSPNSGLSIRKRPAPKKAKA